MTTGLIISLIIFAISIVVFIVACIAAIFFPKPPKNYEHDAVALTHGVNWPTNRLSFHSARQPE